MSYHTARYEKEKLTGIRRQTGAVNLQKLAPVHRLIIGLHITGASNKEIARRVQRTEAWVSTVLGDPLVQQELQALYDLQDSRLKALTVEAVEQLAEALKAPKTQDRLRAVDMILKTQGKYKKEEDDGGKESAEHIIATILSRSEVHIHHHNGEGARVLEHPREAIEDQRDE